MKKNHHKSNRFSIGSWLILSFSIALILVNIGQTIYRFQIPTDGWVWHTGSFGGEEENILIYDANLVGNASPLLPGDRVIAVEGLSVSAGDLTQVPGASGRLAGLKTGDHVIYDVLRGVRALSVEVPLTQWTLAAWFQANIPISTLIFNLAGLLMIGVGLFTFLQRPDLPSARTLLLWCTAIFCVTLSSSLPDNLYNSLDPIAYMGTLLFSYSIFIWLLAPSMLSFTMVFPKPKSMLQGHGWIALVPYFIGVFILLLILSDPASGVLGWIGTLLMLLASAANLIHSWFTQKDAVSRAQLRWAVGGVVLGIGISLLTFLTAFDLVNDWLGEIFGAGDSIGFSIISISLSIAILRYRLWDIDVIIRRTLVYSLLTATLVLVYFGGVVFFQQIFGLLSGQAGQSPLAIVLSTLTIAVLFTPLRRRIQAGIDRRFYRKKYDAGQALAQFAATARDQVELDVLTAELMRVVQETVQPEQVSLWLSSGDKIPFK